MNNTNTTTPLSHAPLLVEFTRGASAQNEPIIERAHHGIIAAVDGDFKPVFSMGDTNLLAHMRSTAKPFQVLPLFDLGFFDDHDIMNRFQLAPYDLVLMMSSHSGQHIHTSRVHDLLAKLGLDHHALRCGSHSPYDKARACELASNHQKASELFNNCSGKHVGMLFACHYGHFDMHTYEQIDHPLQVLIKRLVSAVANFPEHEIGWGVDGCSLPSWVLPLKHIAYMYARLSNWASEASFLQKAFKKIWRDVTAYPEYLAGENRFDTEIIRASAGRIVSKGGADGVHALAIAPDDRFKKGLGVVIKIADGDAAQQIRPLVVKLILEHVGLWPNEPKLMKFLPPTRNFRGLTTGEIISHSALPQFD